MNSFEILKREDVKPLANSAIKCFRYIAKNNVNNKFIFFIFGVSMMENISDDRLYKLALEALENFEKEYKIYNEIYYFEFRCQEFEYIENSVPAWGKI